MKTLLIVTAVLEVGAGLSLIATPSLSATLLLGTALETPVALAVARIAGSAVLALGTACWRARVDVNSPAAIGLVAAMLIYNTAVAIQFVVGGMSGGLGGVGLWLAVILHTVMASWCATCLFRWRASVRLNSGNQP